MGSLISPCTTSYRSSIETIALNCLVFLENRVFCILATDRQTDRQIDEQVDSIDALSRSRCRERRLNKRTNTEIHATNAGISAGLGNIALFIAEYLSVLIRH